MNTFKGRTYAIDARTGKVLWTRQGKGPKPSTPAIAGDRLIVSSTRRHGHRARPRRTGARSGSCGRTRRSSRRRSRSDNTAYFGATDGRLFAVDTRDRHGSAGPTTPAAGSTRARRSAATGSASRRTRARSSASTAATGRKLWITLRQARLRSATRASTRAPRPTASACSRSRARARSSRCEASNGRRLWTHDLSTTGYSTPGVAHGRVFVGDFNGPSMPTPPASGQRALAALRRRPDPRAGASSSASSSSSRRSSRRRTRCASTTDGSSGRSAWASTRPGSRPTGTTTSR